MAAGKITTPKYLELDWNEGDFCSDRELVEGVRLRVLQLRAQGTPGFSTLRMVPAAESEVLRKTLEVRQKVQVYKSKDKVETDLSRKHDTVWAFCHILHGH